ncbi:SEP-domain-containing protein [Metschnikowia bicuspidata]|uniref:SEP-domain-containing protein n=1 Tax=Metschnikowia bicuspidata TaxID=27322 RepID=A0A4P9Z748_9ASCO|nr:SEP-domain-containing protein [Metschnikowia bicuspidata]RKP28879.1 SEP-domain-containing protein [Metschnikowia bicuspidata]
MSDPALLIDSFVAFANCPRYVAEQYLAKHAYDVSAALEGYYRNEDGDENSPRRASPAPPSGIRTFRDLLGDSNDEHRTAQNFFTGGEKSALQVENPDKNDPKKRAAGLVDRIFQRARDQLSEPDDRASAQAASPAAASMSRGTGFRLGDSEHSMEEIPNPNMHRTTPARVTREITFWREGFTVGDGPFRRYDDSENFQLLSELKQGRVPVSLLDVEFGQDVDVTVVRKVDEDYVPPKSSLRGFVGQGQRLGSPVPGDTAERTVPEQLPAAAEPEPPSGDTAVQIRFANGKRLSHLFNATDSIESVYAFVRDHAFNDDTSRDFILSHAFPVKAIEAENATVESARLKNAVIVQRWK